VKCKGFCDLCTKSGFWFSLKKNDPGEGKEGEVAGRRPATLREAEVVLAAAALRLELRKF
jgi:hypothetical protein